jgi:predicted DNA-binding transcriptional regulator AlpA
MERVREEDPAARVRLLRAAEVCKLLGIGTWTLRQWSRSAKFPQPIYISDGAPARWRLDQVERWLDSRARKRRRPIRRGRLRRGAE